MPPLNIRDRLSGIDKLHAYPKRIALDAMGGDGGNGDTEKLKEQVRKNIRAASAFAWRNAAVILVGNDIMFTELRRKYAKSLPPNIFTMHAENARGMDTPFCREDLKDDSSIVLSIALAGEKLDDNEPIAHAAVTSGNSSVAVGSATFLLERLERGCKQRGRVKPAVPSRFPSGVTLLDTGASPGLTKPEEYLDFAVMGEQYVRSLGKRKTRTSPSIGLMNMGEEKWKGTPLLKEAHRLMSQKLGSSFAGNVEGYHLWRKKADIIVCDALVGNPLIKSNKEQPGHWLEQCMPTWVQNLTERLIDKPYHLLLRLLNRTGGAPILGLKGTVYVCNGEASAADMENALRSALQTNMTAVIQNTQQRLKEIYGQC